MKPFGPELDMPDSILAAMWERANWDVAEHMLQNYQQQLAVAAKHRQKETIRTLQRCITDSIEIKMLAVHKLTQHKPSPGVDGVWWRTPAEKMRGAIGLRHEFYRATPVREFSLNNRGKLRTIGVPTLRDRCMHLLYYYALIPVAESTADRKSFAFRPGRTQQDVHYFILEALNRKPRPEWILIADIKSFYDSIDHAWLLEHIPMRKNVLREFLKKGILFDQKEQEEMQRGISLGVSLSPTLANMMLDGLEWRIFTLQDAWKTDRSNVDYSDGNVIRYADDIFITARTESSANLFKQELERFLDERHLRLSEQKTRIVRISDGFDYLSRHYIYYNGYVHCHPSQKAVSRFIDDLFKCIFEPNVRWSQKGLIKRLNKKLQGWISYHRIAECEREFQYVDTVLNGMLLKLMRQYYPTYTKNTLLKKFWYNDPDGWKIFALERDKGFRIVRCADFGQAPHTKLDTRVNPFINKEYFMVRSSDGEMLRLSGKYKAVMERQGWRCYICGQKIAPDDEKMTIPLDMRKKKTFANMVYVHVPCMERSYMHLSMDTPAETVDVEAMAAELFNEDTLSNLPHASLARLENEFANAEKRVLVFSFSKIEEIMDVALPKAAKESTAFWELSGPRTIGHCWQEHGYTCQANLKRKKLVFRKRQKGKGMLEVPQKLLSAELPEKALYELRQFYNYIIKKYGL